VGARGCGWLCLCVGMLVNAHVCESMRVEVCVCVKCKSKCVCVWLCGCACVCLCVCVGGWVGWCCVCGLVLCGCACDCTCLCANVCVTNYKSLWGRCHLNNPVCTHLQDTVVCTPADVGACVGAYVYVC